MSRFFVEIILCLAPLLVFFACREYSFCVVLKLFIAVSKLFPVKFIILLKTFFCFY